MSLLEDLTFWMDEEFWYSNLNRTITRHDRFGRFQYRTIVGFVPYSSLPSFRYKGYFPDRVEL